MADSGNGGAEGFDLGDERAVVHVRPVRTRNGMRLEIRSPRLRHEVRLDPIALESLTWQGPETFRRLLEDPNRPTGGDPSRSDAPEEFCAAYPIDGEQTHTDPPAEFALSNEFATVYLRREGPHLGIRSPRLKHGVSLGPEALESLTWQGPETFSEFLKTPFGPEEHEV
jgi:hypothetical protein